MIGKGAGDAVKRDGDRGGAVPGIIVFIFADIASFVLFFLVFMAERLEHVAQFDRSARLLDAQLGMLNTLILIASGFVVALASTAVKRGDPVAARRLFGLAALIGAGFAIIKAIEYGTKFEMGILPGTNPFFTYYFVLTGLHFVHYVVGMGLLVTLAAGGFRRLGNYALWAESIALYWHMVDVIWVLLFPLLYLQ